MTMREFREKDSSRRTYSLAKLANFDEAVAFVDGLPKTEFLAWYEVKSNGAVLVSFFNHGYDRESIHAMEQGLPKLIKKFNILGRIKNGEIIGCWMPRGSNLLSEAA